MDVPYSELYRRLEERNRNLPEGAFEIPKAEMDRYISIFQPPTGDELVESGKRSHRSTSKPQGREEAG
jgi:hypothetical protein